MQLRGKAYLNVDMEFAMHKYIAITMNDTPTDDTSCDH